MEINIVIPKNGLVRITTVCIREDLWHDLQHHIVEAKRAFEAGEILQEKRYSRAALATLFMYFEAVINYWSIRELKRQGCSERNLRDWMRKKQTLEKCRFLSQQCRGRGNAISMLEFRLDKELRNMLTHPTPRNERAIFEKVSLRLVESSTSRLEEWLSRVSSVLGYLKHNNTQEVARKFAFRLGEMTNEQYSGTQT